MQTKRQTHLLSLVSLLCRLNLVFLILLKDLLKHECNVPTSVFFCSFLKNILITQEKLIYFIYNFLTAIWISKIKYYYYNQFWISFLAFLIFITTLLGYFWPFSLMFAKLWTEVVIWSIKKSIILMILLICCLFFGIGHKWNSLLIKLCELLPVLFLHKDTYFEVSFQHIF